MTLQNPEAAAFFSTRQAHDDIARLFTSSLKNLGEYELRRAPSRNGVEAVCAITKRLVFCGVAGQANTYWRLRPRDLATALRTGATAASIGPDWVTIVSFRADWPNPDLPFWALRAYDYARIGE